jgi:catechol 2,3-dioxygenase
MLALIHLQLRVRDLAAVGDFYARLGFVPVRTEAERRDFAVSAGGPALLTLIADRAADPAPVDAAGLFHAALLLPTRAALGRWLRQAADAGVEFDGFSDHGVSEAIYLHDPEGNGLEFYADRPAAGWPRENGEIGMFTRPLNLPDLLAEAARGVPADPPLAGARWGHLHLRVTDLERSERFYREALGVALTQSSYPGARFLAADGYHHHLGLNTWGRVRQPRHPAQLGLVAATFAQGDRTAVTSLHDPDGIALRVVPAAP